MFRRWTFEYNKRMISIKPHSPTHTGSDLLFAIEQAIATEIQYMIYNTLNSNYLYLVDTLK